MSRLGCDLAVRAVRWVTESVNISHCYRESSAFLWPNMNFAGPAGPHRLRAASESSESAGSLDLRPRGVICRLRTVLFPRLRTALSVAGDAPVALDHCRTY